MPDTPLLPFDAACTGGPVSPASGTAAPGVPHERRLKAPPVHDAGMSRKSRLIAGAIYAICVAEFVVDITVDQRIAFGIFYLPMVGTAVFYRDPRVVWLLACVASVMVGLGFFLPVINESAVEAAINRLISIVAIFVIAGLLHHGRRIQARLAEQTQRAERADQAKARLLTNLSREILTPLNAIVGFSQMLQEGSRPDQRDHLGHIRAAGQRLLSTFMNLIDLTHAEERRLQTIALNLVPALGEAVRATQVQAAERRVVVDVNLGDGAWPDVTADPWAVRRILENLLGNAIKYSHHGERVSIGLERTEEQVGVIVRDSGVGMPPEVVERLGETFFQADPGRPRQFEGMGAGIALSLQLAVAMGGEIRFESVLRRGTTVRLLLPISQRLTIPLGGAVRR